MAIRTALCLFLLLFCSGNSGAVGSALHPKVASFFEYPFRTFRRDRVPKGHRIIALSNLAEYCAISADAGTLSEQVAARCLEDVTYVALHEWIRPFEEPVATAELGRHGLYLSHLNIVLGHRRRLLGPGRHDVVHRKVSEHLARLSIEADHCHAPSFPGVDLRFPADQAATLYSLHLFDRSFGTALAERPTACWLAYGRERYGDGLPVSEISGGTPSSRVARGCALSWTVRYLHAFAPEEAKELWQRYKETFFVDLGLAAGFREWPPGVSFREDVDSGPVVFGIGAAATGLGLVAAAAVGDEQTWEGLKAAEALVRSLGGERLNSVGDSILSVSIGLSAEAQRARSRAQPVD